MRKWDERFSMGPDDVTWPDCPRCIHYDRAAKACPAYPGGVPMPIRKGDETHRTVRPDQVGSTVFTPQPGKE